jgi:hypothetical protein
MFACVLVAAAASLAATASAATPPHYTLTDLGPGVAYGISANGNVAGASNANQSGVAFLWTPGTANGTTGTRTSLGALPTGNGISAAYGVNDYGEVTGFSTSTTSASGIRAFLWKPTVPNGTTGAMTPISGTAWWGIGINTYGQIAIQNDTVNSPAFGQLWTPSTPNGTSGTLTNFSGGPEFSDVSGINASGQLVGAGVDFLGGGGAMISKPTSPNASTGSAVLTGNLGNNSVFVSYAYAINDAGQVAGFSQGAPLGDGSFLWTPDSPNGTTGSMIALPYHLGQATRYLHVAGMNDSTFIVGHDDLSFMGLLWTPADGLLELDSLVTSGNANWQALEPNAINDAGQIVGIGSFDADGPGPGGPTQRAFLLTPVPEPTGAMAIIYLVAALAPRRRRGRDGASE